MATEADRAQVPVPVWLTLGGWDPAVTTLREWAAAKMNLDHPALRAPEYGPDAARELLRSCRVALFLDGLDELPQSARARVLERIREEASGLRVVLTSRPEEYHRTVESAALDNTAVVELLPVRPAAAKFYLLHGQTGPRRAKWAQVTDYLTGNPDSVAARALDNPLALSLARDAYASKDPAELTDPAVFPTPASLLEHLIDQVLIAVYPDELQRAHAARWLGWIARHMGTSRDLAWWDIPDWIPRWQLRLAGVLGFGFLAAMTSALTTDLMPALTAWLGSNSTLDASAGLAYGMVTGLIVGLVVGPWLGRGGKPRALAIRLPGPRQYGRLIVISLLVAIGLLGSGSLALAFSWLFLGLAVVPAIWLAFEARALFSLPAADASSATADSTYRADRITSLATGLMTGLAFGLAAGATATTASAGLLSSLGNTLDAAVPLGCTVAVAAALLTGQVPRLKFTELILAVRYRERINFPHLLEEASRQQILRQAGVVYQFRHAALQDRLAVTRFPADQRRTPCGVSKHGHMLLAGISLMPQ